MAQEEKFSRSFIPPYFDASTHTAPCQNQNHQIQVLGTDHEIFAPGLEMMMGFNISKSTHAEDQIMLEPSSSKTLNDAELFEFYNKPAFTDWVADDSSLRCVLPSHDPGPNRGQSLSLSLNSTTRTEDGVLGRFVGGSTEIKNSKYLIPARELLGEICSIGIPESHEPKHRKKCSSYWDDNDEGIINPCRVSSSDSSTLQKKKNKLFSMIDQVERRYRQYRFQLKGVVSTFEAVAGNGAALAYSAVASNVMSRHFRRLRDGLVEQIKATDRIMGGTESAMTRSRMARGETPRLMILDQSLRQQSAIRQMNAVESSGVLAWRPHRGLPEHSVSVLRAWLFEHFLHPYPSDIDKRILARQACLTRSQVSNWFINARVRLWKPMVEEMYLEETKEQIHDVNINNIKADENVANNLPYRNFLAHS